MADQLRWRVGDAHDAPAIFLLILRFAGCHSSVGGTYYHKASDWIMAKHSKPVPSRGSIARTAPRPHWRNVKRMHPQPLGLSKGERGEPMIRKDRTPSPVVKRSVKIAGHSSSVTLEDAFWRALREIATAQNIRVSELVSRIAKDRQNKNLSSAIRLFVLGYYRQAASDRGC
jgi:predicted DNA-binding ribbon-helix-helix protein